MSKPAAAFVGLLSCISAGAQKPPAWTSDEATIAAILPALARGDEVPFTKKPMQGAQFGDYLWNRFDAPPSAGPGYVCYAWPKSAGTRTFAITDRGIAMFTDQRTRPYGAGECVPDWSACVAKGSEATFAQVLDMPGRGSDDQIWQPVAVVKTVRSRLTVRTDDGAPVQGITVLIAPATWFGVAPSVALGEGTSAVGMSCTDARGEAQWRSVPVEGARAALAIGSTFLPTAVRLQPSDTGPILVVDHAALSQFVEANRNANESAAIATLKNISSAQAQMQACGKNDANANGAGEYAFFAQLSGAAEVQSPAAPAGEMRISPPVLSRAFAKVHGSCVVRSGYLFQIFLPGKDGWVAEAPCGGARGIGIDPSSAEVIWCVYAWPVDAGNTGGRAFYVDQAGDVLSARNAEREYSGRDRRPAPNAAQTGDEKTQKAAANVAGHDGQVWRVIG
jgi:hypothetical protein